MGEMVTIGKGPGQGRAYLARPRLEQAPAILLFHAWWGLNGFMRELANRISDEGYVVMAPEYVRGRLASTIDEAEKIASGMDWQYAYTQAGQALDHLLADEGVAPKKVATIGFSLGAGLTLGLANWRPDAVPAVVLFYGTAPGDYQTIRANCQGHFAEQDPYEGPEQVAFLQEQLTRSGRQVEFYTYPGTGHWFFESDRPDAYNEQAAAQAWQRTLRFLRETIG